MIDVNRFAYTHGDSLVACAIQFVNVSIKNYPILSRSGFRLPFMSDRT